MSTLALNLQKSMHNPAKTLSIAGDSETDESLVVRAKQGDWGAFETLFNRHRTLVYRYAYQMVQRRDDAEDIVQEVFVRAYKNLDRYRDEARFTTWLLRIATNLATDRARMSTRRQALEQQEAQGALTWMTTNVSEDPVENLESERKVLILRKALNALPEHHRNMIILRDIEEREYDEIAGICGTSVGGAKLRVLRARRALRDRMLPLLEEDEKK
ncbi:MAG: RNA polymerase sigma factor [Fimbriimonadaceae bacterium]|nr:RNA polymerase sigma factor [Fimbriimonadaceae bacterium]